MFVSTVCGCRCPGTQSQRTKLEETQMEASEDKVMSTNPPKSPQTEIKEATPSPPAGSNACNNVLTWTEEPGVDNPAFEESTEEDSKSTFATTYCLQNSNLILDHNLSWLFFLSKVSMVLNALLRA